MYQRAANSLRIFLWALSAATLLGACSSSRTSSTQVLPPDGKAIQLSTKGHWNVASRRCGGGPSPASAESWLKVDESETYYNFVSVLEADSDHACFHLDGFQFTLMGFERTDTVVIHRGYLTLTATRDVCYKLEDGARIEPPYKDQTQKIGNDPGAEATLTSDGRLTITTNHRSFCGGAASELLLKRE